ncbi:MAG: ATP-binding protein [Candidatus Omnitrophota bacterium]
MTNDSHLLKQTSREITDRLRISGVKETVIFDIRVAVEESLRNAMIHGNKMDPEKKVTVEADITEKNIRVCVEDEGEGFDPGSLPDPTDEENILKTSGRGVYMIRHLMDEVKYENGGKRIIMIKYLQRKH